MASSSRLAAGWQWGVKLLTPILRVHMLVHKCGHVLLQVKLLLVIASVEVALLYQTAIICAEK